MLKPGAFLLAAPLAFAAVAVPSLEHARLVRLGFDTERAEDDSCRLELDIPRVSAGRHLFIEFDGVAMKSRTYFNDHPLGEHTGMFSRFRYGLTPHLKPGRNVLTMFVSMEKMTGSRHSVSEAVTVNLTAAKVMSLSKGMFGPLTPGRPNREYDLHGIWQPVRLAVRGDGMIEDAGFVPSLTGAEVRVETRALGGRRTAALTAKWTDRATGRIFADAVPVAVELGSTATLALRNVRPHLWTPADPHLYRMEVRLETPGGALLDRVVRNTGFRTFEARGNRLYLNGRPYWLRGGNQLPYGKNPWDPQFARTLIRLLHESNIRVTRTHATPWNEAWLDAAGEIGLGVSIEGIRPWALAGLTGVPPDDIYRHRLMENEDVVRRIRNHPSVLIWTIGNEMMLRDTKSLEKWRLLSGVVKQTRRLDPYRTVVASPEYARDPEFYAKSLAPAGIDDGDIDDIHRHRAGYAESPFVSDSFSPGRAIVELFPEDVQDAHSVTGEYADWGPSAGTPLAAGQRQNGPQVVGAPQRLARIRRLQRPPAASRGPRPRAGAVHPGPLRHPARAKAGPAPRGAVRTPARQRYAVGLRSRHPGIGGGRPCGAPLRTQSRRRRRQRRKFLHAR